jgi:hypothetical protein
MRQFFERWYGDRGPFWTWPVTICGTSLVAIIAIITINYLDLAACRAKGGDAVRHDGCYRVTMTKID